MTKAELEALVNENFRAGLVYSESFADRLTRVLLALVDDGALVLRVAAASPHGDSVSITAVDAVATNGNGGDVILGVGAKNGSGRKGQIILPTFPTADPHVAGALWMNSGVLTQSAG